MKFYRALALMLALVTFAAAPVSAQTWNPPDSDAVLKGIAEETLGVKLIRVLPVGSSGGGTAADVNVLNFPATQPVSGDFYPATQPVSGGVSIDGTVPVTIEPGATINCGNLPAVQPVSGTVAVSGTVPVAVEPGATVNVGNLPATQPVSGTVSVDNLPATQPVSGTVGISGTVPVSVAPGASVSIDNFPATQPVSGDFYPATQPVSGSVAVSTMPAVSLDGTQPVTVDNLPAVYPVAVGNFPATQPVSGTVAVSNFPAAQEVTGDFYPATQPVSGSVNVGNLPAVQTVTFDGATQPVRLEGEIQAAIGDITFAGTQPVAIDDETPVRVAVPGTVGVTGDFYPTTQPVSGTVAVSSLPSVTLAGTSPVEIDDEIPVRIEAPNGVAITNLPATQPVSGSVSVDNFPSTQPVSIADPVAVTGTFYPTTQETSPKVGETWPVSAAAALPVEFESAQPVSISGTVPVIIDDAWPVNVQIPAGTAVTNFPATQAVTPAGTFPVAIAPETPVRVYATDTLPVAVVWPETPPEPVRQRWSEAIYPTVVDGAAVTVALANTPTVWTFANLSATYPVYLRKGGANATASDWEIKPGQALTAEDGDKIFSVYAETQTLPASFQIFSVYEIELQ